MMGLSNVVIEVTNKTEHEDAIPTLLSKMVQANFTLSHVWAKNKTCIQFHMPVAQVSMVRPIVRKSGCRLRIVRKSGIAFWPNRIKQHLFFLVGAFVFIATILGLSAKVWQIDIEGKSTIPHIQVMNYAKQDGLFVGQWKQRLLAPDQLAETLQKQLPQAAWIGIRYAGTHAHIQIVDRVIQKPAVTKHPQHIVATHDAIVTQISATKGTPLVHVHDVVKRGDILISGVVGDDEHQIRVPAEGTVRGLVWYTETVELPITIKDERLTGRFLDQTFLPVFKWEWKLKGYRQKPFKQYKTIRETSQVKLFQIPLPLKIVHQRQWQVKHVIRKRTLVEVRKSALDLANQAMVRSLDKDARIEVRKLLHENSRGGKVYIKVLMEVDQLITKETEIIDRPING
jgi:similar to stage IV sporulation protein